MATARLLKELAEHEHNFDIEVIGEESSPSYNRILLSSLLAEEKSNDELNLIADSWYAENDITLSLAEKVVALDIENQNLTTDRQRTRDYDILIFATGSSPFYPNIEGVDAENVLSFRTQQDLKKIQQLARDSNNAVVIGGGLLGLEAASGLTKLKVGVTVVNRGEWIMQRQLDSTAADLLQNLLEKQGIEFQSNATAKKFCLEGNAVVAIELDSGATLDADMVLVTAGIVPNSGLAKEFGVPCNQGILVDAQLKTKSPNIYALGECCELETQLFGLVAPIYQQAKVLANVLAGNVHSSYAHTDSLTRLKVSGVTVVSAGELPFAESCQSQSIYDRQSGVYRRLVFNDSKLVGFIMIGASDHSSWYEKLMDESNSLSEIRPWMMFGDNRQLSGNLQLISGH
ncbi:MAG: nitrite reductase (NADH) large subunit [Pseudohongiellaceae bacterium]|jgi:nitrite reductase (NADH) large subunit